MARIKSKNTKPELLLFSLLNARRVYFSRHVRSITGSPDVVFRRARVAVFVDGELWHGYRFEDWKDGLSPTWRTKIERNLTRDRDVDSQLRDQGWEVIRLWGKQLQKNPQHYVDVILQTRADRLTMNAMRENA
jgi:DNA mismatch endonuclease (patch repair protein)